MWYLNYIFLELLSSFWISFATILHLTWGHISPYAWEKYTKGNSYQKFKRIHEKQNISKVLNILLTCEINVGRFIWLSVSINCDFRKVLFTDKIFTRSNPVKNVRMWTFMPKRSVSERYRNFHNSIETFFFFDMLGV